MKILFVVDSCILDSRNGAAVASRALLSRLSNHSHNIVVVSGSLLSNTGSTSSGQNELFDNLEAQYTITQYDNPLFGGVIQGKLANNITIFMPFSIENNDHSYEIRGTTKIFPLFAKYAREFQPDIVVGYGTGLDQRKSFEFARRLNIASTFIIHNLQYNHPSIFMHVTSIITPSIFAAKYYHNSLGIFCHVISNVLDEKRFLCSSSTKKYVTFINPTQRKGVFVFARIASELGKVRPDIKFLVIESNGSELDVAACGLDLRLNNNVFFMEYTDDPKKFWCLTRICLMPSLWWENQPLTAIEAMANGIPVIGSNRGGIPETLDNAGIVLPLPERLTGISDTLPSPSDINAWINAIVLLWDDNAAYNCLAQSAIKRFEHLNSSDICDKYEKEFLTAISINKSQPFASYLPLPISGNFCVLFYGNGIKSDELALLIQECESAAIKIAIIENVTAENLNVVMSQHAFNKTEAILLLNTEMLPSIYDIRRVFARPEPIITSAAPFSSPATSQLLELSPTSHLNDNFIKISTIILKELVNQRIVHVELTRNQHAIWSFFQSRGTDDGRDEIIIKNIGETFDSLLNRIDRVALLDPFIIFS